jgi:hypothetical protein
MAVLGIEAGETRECLPSRVRLFTVDLLRQDLNDQHRGAGKQPRPHRQPTIAGAESDEEAREQEQVAEVIQPLAQRSDTAGHARQLAVDPVEKDRQDPQPARQLHGERVSLGDEAARDQTDADASNCHLVRRGTGDECARDEHACQYPEPRTVHDRVASLPRLGAVHDVTPLLISVLQPAVRVK